MVFKRYFHPFLLCIKVASALKGLIVAAICKNIIFQELSFSSITVGNLSVNTVEPESWDEIDSLYPQLSAGGRWWPAHCRARHRVAIIVPYRDREAHLKIFLRHIHSYVQAQQIEYAIFVVEQVCTNIRGSIRDRHKNSFFCKKNKIKSNSFWKTLEKS